MGNIVTAKVSIAGERPILWHWFGPDAIPLEKQERTGVAGNDPEEWRRTCLATKDGQLYIEATYIFSAMAGKFGGAGYVKKGRGSIRDACAATLQVVDDRILIDRWLPGFPNGHTCNLATLTPPERDPDLPVFLDVRSVIQPTTKARNIRYRVGANPGWHCSFTIQWDKTIVSRGEMEAVLINTGKLVGLGSGRKIGRGRFEIESFTVED